MQPRGPLMIEHRLIMRMIHLIDNQVKKLEIGTIVNQSFIDAAIDFIRTYADRTHHGKEENILFRDLSNKNLSETDKEMMDELIQEHNVGRDTVAALTKAANEYKNGDTSALPSIIRSFKKFVAFYPLHIEKEEKIFFPASTVYFSESEQESMIAEFWEFDRKMIHEKYKSVVAAFE